MKQVSAAQTTRAKEKREDEVKKKAASRTASPPDGYREHSKIVSRTTGRVHEISFGPQYGGLVPANPFASLAQARFAHANPKKFGGKKGLDEWDAETKWIKIPKHK